MRNWVCFGFDSKSPCVICRGLRCPLIFTRFYKHSKEIIKFTNTFKDNIMTDEEFDEESTKYFNNNPTIYKYSSFKSVFNMLATSELQFSNPSSFNDPYDCYPGLIYIKHIPDSLREEYIRKKYSMLTLQQQKELLKDKKEGDIVDNELYPLLNTNYQNIIKARGISCFSQIDDNLLMWSHYAQSHTGVCVGFDYNTLCNYLKDICPKKLTVERVKYIEKFESNDYFTNPVKAHLNMMTTKSINWEYEKEVRIIFSHVDFKEEYAQFPFCKESVNKVFLGCKMKTDERNSIVEICRVKYPHTEIFEMELDKNSFKLIAEPVI